MSWCLAPNDQTLQCQNLLWSHSVTLSEGDTHKLKTMVRRGNYLVKRTLICHSNPCITTSLPWCIAHTHDTILLLINVMCKTGPVGGNTNKSAWPEGLPDIWHQVKVMYWGSAFCGYFCWVLCHIGQKVGLMKYCLVENKNNSIMQVEKKEESPSYCDCHNLVIIAMEGITG